MQYQQKTERLISTITPSQFSMLNSPHNLLGSTRLSGNFGAEDVGAHSRFSGRLLRAFATPVIFMTYCPASVAANALPSVPQHKAKPTVSLHAMKSDDAPRTGEAV